MIRSVLLALFLILLTANCSIASSINWEKTIAAVEKRSKEYEERAASFGVVHIGTMWNEIDADVHKCAILARILGHKALARRLDVKHVSIKSRNGQELAMARNSLANWASEARHALSLTRSQSIEVWNLDCVGRFDVPRSLFIARHDGMKSFFIVQGDVIRVLGDVEANFFADLKNAIDSNPKAKIIALGSGGGFVSEAIESARYIREKKLDTVLWNNCLSACALVFLGGVERTIWSPYPSLGFHRVSKSGIAVRDDDAVYDMISRFSAEMGANGPFVVGLMKMAEPNEMYKLKPGDTELLCRNRIATWIQRVC